MRVVFEHSWSLLSEAERAMFKKLSVFRGGFRQAAAEQVAGASLLVLTALVDKSLLRVNSSGRYEFHELLRQYAEERLEAWDEENERIQGLHCDYYAEFLYERRHASIGSEQAEFMEELEEEIENIRVAWNHAVAQEDLDAIGKSLDSLYRFYGENSWYLQGVSAFDRAVAAVRTGETTGKRGLILGQLLARQAYIHLGLYQNTEQAKELAQESLAILDHLGARRETCWPLFALGYAARVQGEREEGKQFLQRCLLIARELDDRWRMAMALAGLSQIAEEGAHRKEGKRLRQESLALFRQIGDRWGVAWMLSESSGAALWRGACDEAYQYAQESLDIASESHSQQQTVHSLLVLSNATFAIGAYEKAKRYAREGLAITQAVARFGFQVMFINVLARINSAMQEYETAKQLFQESLMVAQEINDLSFTAIPLQGLGRIAYCKGDYSRAYRLYLESLTLLMDTNRRPSAGAVLNDLGLVAHALGDDHDARAHFHEALKIELAIEAFPILLETLIGIAELTASEGQFELAVALLSLGRHHAASFADTRVRAEHCLAELESELPPDVFTQAQQRGAAMDLESVATAQLSELSRWLRAHKKTRQKDQPLAEPLSERELEVLGFMAEGMSNREIAERLFITAGTVKVHASNIYGKLDVSNRTQAVTRVRELGLQ
jgi:ATP/maltotriose-dependent transcriptional regulator MalT